MKTAKGKLIRRIVGLMDEGSNSIMKTLGNDVEHTMTELKNRGLLLDRNSRPPNNRQPNPTPRWIHKSPITRMMLLDLADQYDRTAKSND